MALIKCPHPKCQAENDHDAEFCRVCGKKLHYVASLEKFPDYNLKPVTYFEKYSHFNFLLFKILKIGYFKRIELMNLELMENEIDYLQFKMFAPSFFRNYLFYVKDSHIGVIKFNKWTGGLSIQIPAIFDYIEWYKKNELLKVYKDNRWYIIDINGNELK